VVEDDRHIQNLFEYLIDREGFQYIPAGSARAARGALDGEAADLILLDLGVAEEMTMGDMMTLLKLHNGKYSLVERVIGDSSPVAGKRIRDFRLPQISARPSSARGDFSRMDGLRPGDAPHGLIDEVPAEVDEQAAERDDDPAVDAHVDEFAGLADDRRNRAVPEEIGDHVPEIEHRDAGEAERLVRLQ